MWIYVSRKKTPNFFRNISYKTRAIVMKVGTQFPEEFCAKSCKRFPPHPNNVATLLVKLKMLSLK